MPHSTLFRCLLPVSAWLLISFSSLAQTCQLPLAYHTGYQRYYGYGNQPDKTPPRMELLQDSSPYAHNFTNGYSQYYISQYATDYRTARYTAKRLNGNLVDFNTQGEYNLVLQKLQQKFGVKMPTVWIGATDSIVEGQFRWDATGLGFGLVPPWAPGEPNNYGNEDYVSMKDGRWNDEPAGSKRRFIVELKNGNYNRNAGTSGMYPNQYFDLFDPAYIGADEQNGFGGRPIYPQNPVCPGTRLMLQIWNPTNNFGQPGCGGGPGYCHRHDIYRLIDNRGVKVAEVTSVASQGSQRFMMFFTVQDSTQTFYLMQISRADTTCRRRMAGYFFRTDATPPYDILNGPALGSPITGFSYAGARGNKEYYLSNGTATWPQAQAACRANNGNLATVSSMALNSFVNTLATTPLWIGLSDTQAEGQFTWASAEPLSYANWATGEPNNAGNEDYVALVPNAAKGARWNDASGTQQYRYVMEVPVMQFVHFTRRPLCWSQRYEVQFNHTEYGVTYVMEPDPIFYPNGYYYYSQTPWRVEGTGGPMTVQAQRMELRDANGRKATRLRLKVTARRNAGCSVPLGFIETAVDTSVSVSIAVTPDTGYRNTTYAGTQIPGATYAWGFSCGMQTTSTLSIYEPDSLLMSGYPLKGENEPTLYPMTGEDRSPYRQPPYNPCSGGTWYFTASKAGQCASTAWVNYESFYWAYQNIRVNAKPGFIYRGQRDTLRYYLSTGTYDFRGAREAARRQGGKLVTILTAAENDWVAGRTLLRKPMWVGLTDSATEGQYRWLSGRPFGYSNWAPGEPNNAGNEDYVSINNNAQGKWNDNTRLPLYYALMAVGPRNYRQGIAEAIVVPYKLTAYPNPASTLLFVTSEAQERLTLYSSDGRLAATLTADLTGAAELNVRQLPKGIYLLKGSKETLRISVQ